MLYCFINKIIINNSSLWVNAIIVSKKFNKILLML